MIDKTAIKNKAKARELGIEGYRTMSPAALKDAIARAQGKATAPAKGKSPAKGKATNGSKGKGKAKAAVKRTVAKGKAVVTKGKGKTAPAAKSKSQKSSPAKGKATAAKGKASRAKTAKAPKTTTRRKAAPARADIDRKSVNWKVESNIGKSGKRKQVMDALIKYKGDYDKCFADLKRYGSKWYPGHENPQAMVRWLINRVAFDFVMATEQHEPGERAAYGTSEAPQDIRRREAREKAAKKARRKVQRGRPAKTTARKTTKGKGKAAPAKGKGKTTTAKGKGTRSNAKRKSAAKGRR